MTRRLGAACAAFVIAGTLAGASPAQADDCSQFKNDVENATNGATITLDAGLTCHDTPYTLPQGTAPFAITIEGNGSTLDGQGAGRIMTGTTTTGKVLDLTVRNLRSENGDAASTA